MNLRHRYVVIGVRVVLGLLFLFSGISGLMMDSSMQGVPAPMVPYLQSLLRMGIFHMIKITEVISGLMLVIGFLPALAVLFLAPLCIGIMVVNISIAPEALPMGIFVNVLTIYLGYAYWDKYKGLFQWK